MSCQFRTDLAIETAEIFQESNELQGVRIDKTIGKISGIEVTRVTVENEIGAQQLGKSIGEYITLNVPELDQSDLNYHREISQEIIQQLRLLAQNFYDKNILVAGLGNRKMAPDALGPMVVDNLFVTRHMMDYYGKETSMTKGMGCVSALAPGVMAQTGIETQEILKGAVKAIHPDLLIVIDALAARSVHRLNKTIQLTNTGIAPGAGVGNRRHGIDEQSMGVPVIAIGIPTVIDIASIVNDIFGDQIASVDVEMMNMFVTPKNIDEIVVQMSYTISEALNRICHPMGTSCI